MEDPQNPEEIQLIPDVRTRCGYLLKDILKEFKLSFEQPGSTYAAKCLHYTADLICSECFGIWKKFLWEYAFEHIGIGSPRVFFFLQKQLFSLENTWNTQNHTECYNDPAFQKLCVECILILRSCPRKPQLKIPRVPAEAHNERWIQEACTAPPSAAVAKVFKSSHDTAIVKKVGDEFVRAITEGATEKALFWMKWLFEEDLKLRKEHQGHGLTTLERGPTTVAAKARSHIGYFLIYLMAEIYKELQGKQLIRMTDEFQALLNLYLRPDTGMTAKRKQDCMILCIQILCEVPRWKVPAAPGLVSDMTQFKRALEHSEQFFREVLTYDKPDGDLEKEAKKIKQAQLNAKKLDTKKLKEKSLNAHLDAFDNAMAQFYGM